MPLYMLVTFQVPVGLSPLAALSKVARGLKMSLKLHILSGDAGLVFAGGAPRDSPVLPVVLSTCLTSPAG